MRMIHFAMQDDFGYMQCIPQIYSADFCYQGINIIIMVCVAPAVDG